MQTFKNHINFGKLYLGNILIILGFIYLLNGLGIYSFDFSLNLFEFIPILIVSFGLSLLDLRRTTSIILGTISTLLLVVISILFILNSPLYGNDSFISNGRYFMMNRFFNNSMPCQNILFDSTDTTNGY